MPAFAVIVELHAVPAYSPAEMMAAVVIKSTEAVAIGVELYVTADSMVIETRTVT